MTDELTENILTELQTVTAKAADTQKLLSELMEEVKTLQQGLTSKDRTMVADAGFRALDIIKQINTACSILGFKAAADAALIVGFMAGVIDE